MRRSLRTAGVTLFTASLVAAQLVVAVDAHSAPTTRYVGPAGSGATCSKPSPCQLVGALAASKSGDSVILEPGTYPGTGTAYTNPLQTPNAQITIEGEPGAARPVINSTAQFNAVAITYESTLRDVQINYVGQGVGLDIAGAHADHVVVLANSSGGGVVDPACSIDGPGTESATLTDSVCEQSGNGVPAISLEGNGNNFTGSFRNVTGIATGTAGVGLEADEIGNGTIAFTATNSIFKGPGDDVVALGSLTGTARISLSYCDYKTTLRSSANAAISQGAGNIKAAPKFIDAAHANYREAAGSPTIDAGTTTGVPAHDTDLAGAPRILGTGPDIGAYEHLAKPTIGGLRISHVKKHSMLVTVSVDPGGAKTTVKVAVTRAHHTKKIKASAGSGATAKKVHVHLNGLTAKTRYGIRASAKNSQGRKHTPKTSVTSK